MAIWRMIDLALAHTRRNECTSHTSGSCWCCTSDQENGIARYRNDPLFRHAIRLIEGGERDLLKIFANMMAKQKRRAQRPNYALDQALNKVLDEHLELTRMEDILESLPELFAEG